MKNTILLLIVITLLFSCKSEPKETGRAIVIGDTITTKSGLSYIFLKEGKGRKIEPGSRVEIYTDLYLNDADTTIWRTADDKDSIFSFIHQKTSLIKGFTEVHDYLVEGDEIIALLPDSLAYGEKGRGTVPPKATLVYNPLIVKYVSEPKMVLADTLLTITKSKGVTQATALYEEILKGESANSYHLELDGLRSLTSGLAKDSLFVELEQIANYFMTKTDDKNIQQTFVYNQEVALVGQGKIKEAIAIVEPMTKQDLNKDYWVTRLKELNEKLE